MKKLLLIGGGGHCKVVIEIIKKINSVHYIYEVIGIIDTDSSRWGHEIGGISILGGNSVLENILDKDIYCVVSIGNNAIRKRIVESLLNRNFAGFETIIHPSAIISSESMICRGTVVMPGVIINPSSHIGAHCILNTGVIVEHDNEIGEYSHLSPRVVTAGGVSIGCMCHIGIGASIIEMIKIGNETIIGAGSAVISNVPPQCMAAGVPAVVRHFFD